jgi:antitoxin component YwqK of YwqJK toxin-antitoxin module
MNYSTENPLEVSIAMFNEQGVLVAQGEFYDKKKQGLWQYFENNQLIAEDMFDKGLLDGTSTIYWQTTQNKQAAEVKNWEQGKKQGAWLWFYESGQVRMTAYYVQNKLEGKFIVYYANGGVMLSGMYKNNRRNGDWTYKNEDGSTQIVLQYADGKLLNEDEYEREQTRQINEQWNNIPDFAEPDMHDPALLSPPAPVQNTDANDPSNYTDNPEEFIMREMAPGTDFDAQQEDPKKQKRAKNAAKIK